MDISSKDKKTNNSDLIKQLILMVEEIREQNKIIIEELAYIKVEKPEKSRGWFG